MFKKFISLKYKAKSVVRTVLNNNDGENNIDQQNQAKSSANTFEKVNSTNHENKPNKNVNERIRSLSPANQRPKQGIIRSRNNSKTNLSSNYKYQQEIKQLKDEFKLLKQTKNNHQE